MSDFKLDPILDHKDREVLVGTLFEALLQTDEKGLLKALQDHQNRVAYYIQLSQMENSR